MHPKRINTTILITLHIIHRFTTLRSFFNKNKTSFSSIKRIMLKNMFCLYAYIFIKINLSFIYYIPIYIWFDEWLQVISDLFYYLISNENDVNWETTYVNYINLPIGIIEIVRHITFSDPYTYLHIRTIKFYLTYIIPNNNNNNNPMCIKF